VTRVLTDVRAFTAGAKQSDDITVLAARYAG
jgi:serine phosphatase RsbU (regulator of sigma subunit)